MLIDAEKFLDFLEDIIEQSQANVYEYEEFHGNHLAHIPSMNPMDSFLYGVASGKKDMADYIKMLVETRMEEME